jgi:hypothetical protein
MNVDIKKAVTYDGNVSDRVTNELVVYEGTWELHQLCIQ